MNLLLCWLSGQGCQGTVGKRNVCLLHPQHLVIARERGGRLTTENPAAGACLNDDSSEHPFAVR